MKLNELPSMLVVMLVLLLASMVILGLTVVSVNLIG